MGHAPSEGYTAYLATGDYWYYEMMFIYQTLLANHIAHWIAVKNGIGGNGPGYVYEYNLNAYTPGFLAPWMEHF